MGEGSSQNRKMDFHLVLAHQPSEQVLVPRASRWCLLRKCLEVGEESEQILLSLPTGKTGANSWKIGEMTVKKYLQLTAAYSLTAHKCGLHLG